jgi:single-stranded DNA-binding protein
MAHTVSGKLRKAPFIKTGCGPQQDSTMYVIELSEMVKDWQTQEKHYTNYSAMFFAKTQGANDLYSKVFAEGSFVVVSCEKLKTDIQQGQDGRTFVKMQMENPRLESFMAVSEMGAQHQGGYQQPAQQQAPQQRQQTQQQYNEPPMDFDDDIPF